jgi:hypothetical protein
MLTQYMLYSKHFISHTICELQQSVNSHNIFAVEQTF